MGISRKENSLSCNVFELQIGKILAEIFGFGEHQVDDCCITLS